MRFPMIAATLLLLAACGAGEDEPHRETVEHAWVRLPAVDGRPAAAYFDLYGDGDGRTLIAMDSARVESIELHESTMTDGVMRMEQIPSIEIQLGETVSFAPGGKHAMLFGVDPEITPGTPLTLNFRFANGRDIQVEAVTIAAGDDAPFNYGDEG